jgi:hypothetical protein
MDLNQEKLVTFNELEPSVLAAKYGFIAVASEDGEIRIYCETKLYLFVPSTDKIDPERLLCTANNLIP